MKPSDFWRFFVCRRARHYVAVEKAKELRPGEHCFVRRPTGRFEIVENLVPAGSRLKDTIKDMNMRQRLQGAAGPMNIAMNPQTTINGASAGQEQALARQFERVMQDSNRALIARLKEARNYEERLGYV